MSGAVLWQEPVSETLQSAAKATGDGRKFALNRKYGGLVVQVSGSFTATITFEATYNGDDWVSVLGRNVTTGVVEAITTTAGAYSFDVQGVKDFRARVSAYISGEVTAVGVAVAIASTDTGGASVQGVEITGNKMDLRGMAGDRPDFGDVEVGTTYWSVDSGDIHVATDSTWEVV